MLQHKTGLINSLWVVSGATAILTHAVLTDVWLELRVKGLQLHVVKMMTYFIAPI